MNNTISPDDQAHRRVIRAWCMYDWANSVYNLVITTTFGPIYFAGITRAAYGENSVPFLGRTFKNSALYNYNLSFAYLTIAILLPILSSIADSRGSKKRFMQFFCYMGGLGCAGLFFFKGEQPSVGWGLLCFTWAAIGYIGSLVFYNSYLPEIATLEERDQVSARGFSMGYLGGVTCQLIGFGLVLYFSSKGDKTSGPLYTFLLVGIWWVSFAQITFANLPASSKTLKPGVKILTSGFVELQKVWKQVQQMRTLKWYLTAFFFYSMGVQTVMLAASLFASQILGLPADRLIITMVMIQLVAIGGANLISKLSGRFGNISVLMVVVSFWVLVCLAAYFVAGQRELGSDVEFQFYGIAIAVGLVMGGIQSLSRSTYSKLMPVTKDTASFFSFYDVAEKLAIVIGIFTFGYVDELFGMKHSVLALIIFFVMGFAGLVMTRRNELRSVQ